VKEYHQCVQRYAGMTMSAEGASTVSAKCPLKRKFK
jgi:hypothetical protein